MLFLQIEIKQFILTLLLVVAGLDAFGQTLEWEAAYPQTAGIGTDFRSGKVKLSDTVMVFSGSTYQYGRRPGSGGSTYARDCLLFVDPRNMRPPKMTLLPAYQSRVALCAIEGQVHGMAIGAPEAVPGGPERLLYFRCSAQGDILDTLFLDYPDFIVDFSSAAPMGDGLMLLTSRAYRSGQGYRPWLGLFDIRSIRWRWQKTLDSIAGNAGIGQAQPIYGGRALVSGHHGYSVYASIVDTAGPGPVTNLWNSPDTAHGFDGAFAWPRPDGGWVVSGAQAGQGRLAFLDASLNQTYYSSGWSTFTVLSDNGFFVSNDHYPDVSYCRLNDSGRSEWCYAGYRWPQYNLVSALPADSGGAVVFGETMGSGASEDFFFARFAGVGEFYNPATDSTRFPITAIKQSRKAGMVLKAWPNPASSFVQVQGNAMRTIDLLSLDGRVLEAHRLDGSGRVQINLAALPKGMYLLRCEGSVLRVVKE